MINIRNKNAFVKTNSPPSFNALSKRNHLLMVNIIYLRHLFVQHFLGYPAQYIDFFSFQLRPSK